MSKNVYQPCPFCTDTDKKIKFCCADIADDMIKVMRQIEGGQQRTALKRLEKLGETHPDTVWNQLTRVIALSGEDRQDEIIPILEHLYRIHPDHPAVLTMYAGVLLGSDGFRAARDVIWRVLRKAHAPAPMLTDLLINAVVKLRSDRCYVAARQLLAVALVLAPNDEKQKVFMGLMALDSDANIPYPLRCVHSLRPMSGEAERQEAAHKATRLAERGCFGPAAERFAALAASQPADAPAEYNTGLCRAWAGDQLEAAAAFGRAAQAESDFEIAAEYALLCQVLRALESESPPMFRTAAFRIDSTDRAIEALEELPNTLRQPIPPANPEDEEDMPPDALFDLADRDIPASYVDLPVDDCPRRLAICSIVGADKTGGEAELRLVCDDAASFDECWSSIAKIVGSTADSAIEDNLWPDEYLVPSGFEKLSTVLSLPPGMPILEEHRFQDEFVDQLIEQWLHSPLELLDGLTPAQAAEQPERQVEAAGLVYVLDLVLFQQRISRDLGDIRKRLGLPEIETLTPEPGQSLHSYSTIQMHRMRIEELDDRQLGTVLNRAMLMHYAPFLRRVLLEVLDRDADFLEKPKIYSALARLARERGDLADGLNWIEKGRRSVPEDQHAFLEIARWDLQEFSTRLDHGDSPEFQEFLRGIVGYYGPKVPEMLDIMREQLEQLGIELPTVHIGDGQRPTAGALWTPDQPGGSGQKLWLPGT